MIRGLLLAGTLLATPHASLAHEFGVDSLVITHPFFRATPPMAQTAGGYLVLTNNGPEAERLIAIETEAAKSVEFHQTVVKDGIATMTPVTEGFLVKPGERLVIGAEGRHIMLLGLPQPIGLGEVIEATLVFEKAGRFDMYFEVEPLGKVIDQQEGHHGQ